MNDLVPAEKTQWNLIKEQCENHVKSGLLPRAVNSPEKAVAIATMGLEMGLKPWQSLRGIYVVNGMPTMGSQLMLALIYHKYPQAQIIYKEMSNQRCVLHAARPGSAQLSAFSFGVEDAKLAGLFGKDNWKKHPADMLRNRCISKMARSLFPEVIMGLYTPDEIEAETQEPIRITTQPSEPPPATVVVAEPVQDIRPQVIHKLSTAEGEIPTKPAPAVSRAQLNRMFALMNQARWSVDELKSYIETKYEKMSSKDLTRQEYDDICNVLIKMSDDNSKDDLNSQLSL